MLIYPYLCSWPIPTNNARPLGWKHIPLINPVDKEDESISSGFCEAIYFDMGNAAISTNARYFSVHFQSLTTPSLEPI